MIKTEYLNHKTPRQWPCALAMVTFCGTKTIARVCDHGQDPKSTDFTSLKIRLKEIVN